MFARNCPPNTHLFCKIWIFLSETLAALMTFEMMDSKCDSDAALSVLPYQHKPASSRGSPKTP